MKSSAHVISFFFFLLIVGIISICSFGFHSPGSSSSNKYLHSANGGDFTRKLLFHGSSSSCTTRDLSISQSQGSATGIPQYIVQIANTCVSSSSSCAPSNIHVHCGWFASARMVNPRFFKRLSYDDCLVNGGYPLQTGQVITFSYSSTFMYPIFFKEATFC